MYNIPINHEKAFLCVEIVGTGTGPSNEIIPPRLREPEDLKKSDNLRPDDIAIMYAQYLNTSNFITDTLRRFMGPTGSGKSNVR